MTSAAESTVKRNIHKTVSSKAVKVLITAIIVIAMRTPKGTMAAALQQKISRVIQGRRQTCHRYAAKQRGLMRTNFSKGRTNYRSRPAPEAHNGWRQQAPSPSCASTTRVDPVEKLWSHNRSAIMSRGLRTL